MIRKTRLLDWVDEYALSVELRDVSIEQYKRCIKYAEKWCGEPLFVESISAKLINEMIVRMQAAGKSGHYIRSLKHGVLAVWNAAAAEGLCDIPGRLRRVRSESPTPLVWTPEQMVLLVLAANELEGHIFPTNRPRAWYWSTLIRMAWESGLRRRDLQRLRRMDIGTDFVMKQNKTGKPVRVRLSQSLVDAIMSERMEFEATLWPLWGTDETFRQHFARIVRRAKIPYGPFKVIRKSAGTAAEIAQPGAGHYLLGNTRKVFETNYLDPTKIDTPRPPEIG